MKARKMNADAMKAPIKRPRCADANPMTPERILAIAKQKGVFAVSWQYRNDALRKRCHKMVKAGLLRRVHCAPGENQYAAVEGQP